MVKGNKQISQVVPGSMINLRTGWDGIVMAINRWELEHASAA